MVPKSVALSQWGPDKMTDMLWELPDGPITLTPYMVLPLFATRFADYAGGNRVSFIQPRLF